MTYAIFCPSSHLILDAPRCPSCGWERPTPGLTGTSAWGPVNLRAGLGGPGRHVFARPAALNGETAWPIKGREIAGLSSVNGVERWRKVLKEGQVARHIVADSGRFLFAISDERPLGQAGQARLAAIDPMSGELTSLWEDQGHLLSLPVLTADLILLRTTRGLVALSRAAQPVEQWRLPLKTWWSLPCLVAEGAGFVVDGNAMQNIGQLQAYDLQDQRLLWSKDTDGMLNQPLTFAPGVLIFQNGRSQIMALRISDGRELWKQNFAKLYTPPQNFGGQLLFVSRGSLDSQAADHYLLNALDAVSGKQLWQAPLAGRAFIPPLVLDGRIYLTSDDGRLFGFAARDGKFLFEKSFSSDEDPPMSELLVDGGMLFSGTYFGHLHTFTVQTSQPDPQENLAVLLERGEFEQAAAIFALRADFKNAAALYAEKLNNIPRALAIYEHAKLYREAARLAESHEMWAEAEQYYRAAGDLLKTAEMLLKRGDQLGAARLFEQAGEMRRAAELFEQVKDYLHAMELYLKVNDQPSYFRLYTILPPSSQKVQLLIDQARYSEAAEVALEAGLLRWAVDLFKQAGEEGRELEALLKLQETQPDEWLFQRLALLARKAGRFAVEAGACEKLGHSKRTAEAYYRAARQAEHLTPDASQAIGNFFQKAMQYYEDAGWKNEEAICREKMITYLELPRILLESTPRAAFNEGEFNSLELLVWNTGNGVAREVTIEVLGKRFEVDKGSLRIGNLAEGLSVKQIVRIRPRDHEVGDTVPLELVSRWLDQHKNAYEERISADIPVHQKGDTRPDAAPQIFNINGDFVQGGKINGDKLEGNASKQVGDKAEIHRTGGPGVAVGSGGAASEQPAAKEVRVCPNCKMPGDPASQFCDECGHAF